MLLVLRLFHKCEICLRILWIQQMSKQEMSSASSIWIKTKQEVYIHCLKIYLCRFWGVDPIIPDIIKASVLRIVWRLAATDYPISNCTIPISKGKSAKRYQHYLVQQMTEKGFKKGHCINFKQCFLIHHEGQCHGRYFVIVKVPVISLIYVKLT